MMATSVLGSPRSGYQPGICNIGPAEIAARRRTGDIGALVTAIAFLLIIVTGAPIPWRLVLFLPASVAASGYLQARLRFCANFGLRGVFNFSNRLRDTESVPAAEARAQDRRKALEIVSLAAFIGAATAIAAVLLPI